jgi:hypothetical protein
VVITYTPFPAQHKDALLERVRDVCQPFGKDLTGQLVIEVNGELYEVFLPRLSVVVELHHSIVNGLHQSLHTLLGVALEAEKVGSSPTHALVINRKRKLTSQTSLPG